MNRQAFKKMKPGVRIINCARGGLIDEAALLEALKDGKVAGAALDVYETEPPPPGWPLREMPNVICTPHLGASTEEAQANVAVAVCEQIVELLLYGTIKNAVNAPSVSQETMAKLKPYLTLAEALGSFQAQMTEGAISAVSIAYIGEVSGLDTKCEQIVELLLYGTIKNAVNAPSVSQETMAKLKPYLTLAEALGSFQAQMTEGAISAVSIAYIGEVSGLDTKPLTHSLLKGLLYPVMHDEVNYVNAPAMAASRGIHISEEKAASAEDFANLIRLTVRANNEENTVAGTIFGKYEPRLVRINKFRLEATPEGHMLFIYNTDRPGVIGAIGSTIGKHKINIARMTVGQERERGQNIILLTTDTPLTPECLKDVRALEHVAEAIQLEL